MRKLLYGYSPTGQTAVLLNDVTRPLDDPCGARVFTFAHSTTEAWARLGELDMAPTSHRHLHAMGDPLVRALIGAGLNQPRATYAIGGNNAVVAVTTHPSETHRVVAYIGYIQDDEFISSNADADLTEAEPVITDAMVEAAFDALGLSMDGDSQTYEARWPITPGDMRAAITAALKAQATP